MKKPTSTISFFILAVTFTSFLNGMNCQSSKPCSEYFDSKNKLVHIPINESCLIQESESFINEIITIHIEGNLYIEDTFSLHLKIKSLSIGPNGLLSIGLLKPILNNLIVLEQFESISSIDTNLEGKIEIYSMPYQVYPLFETAFKDEYIIQLSQNPSYINMGDHIYVIGSFQYHSEERVKVNRITNAKIFLESPLIQDYIKHLDSTKYSMNTFAFSALRKLSGVQMINMCLTGRVTKIIGVAFIGTQKLNLSGGIIQNCLFTEKIQRREIDQNQLLKKKQLQIEGQLRENIFFQLENVHIKLTNFADKNSFINIYDSKIDSQGEINEIYLHSCDLEILNSFKQNSLIFNNIQSYNSRYLFQNQSYQYKEIKILNQTLFYKMNTFYLNQIHDLLIDNSLIIQSPFRFNNSNIKTIELRKSSFLGEQFKSDLFSFQQDSEIIPPKIFLILKHNTFIGFTGSIFSTFFNPQRNPQEFAQKNSEINFDIVWEENSYEEQSPPIFDLDRKKITLIKDDKISYVYSYQNTFKKNITQSLCHIPFVKINENEQLLESETMPSYYSLSIHETVEDQQEQSNIIFYYATSYEYIGYDSMNAYYNSLHQILPNQLHTINLEKVKIKKFPNSTSIPDSNYIKLKLELFEITTQDIDITKIEQPKQIILTFTNSPLLKISIKEANSNYVLSFEHQNQNYFSYDKQEDSFKNIKKSLSQATKQNVVFQFNRQLNYISIIWFNLPPEGISFLIKIENCNKGEIIDAINNRCTTEIHELGFLHKLYFDYKCNHGYVSDQINKQICLKCPIFQCKKCDEYLIECQECLDGFLLYQNQCLKECPSGTYLKDSSCYPCIEGCRKCKQSNYCEDCFEKNTDYLCSPCKQNQTLENENCVNCPQPHCKSCNSVSPFNCKECELGYEKVNGICQIIFQHQMCLIGSIEKNGFCIHCSELCLSCTQTQGQSCLSCIPSAKSMQINKEDKACIQCDNGYYGEGEACIKCDEGCLECFGQTNRQCFTCQENYEFGEFMKCIPKK